MSDDEKRVQIFISYARDDDKPPPGMADAKGFVTFLHDQLEYEFTSIGQPRPKIWRDTRDIAKAAQFGPLIEEALDDSSFLVVILSNNWMSREWTRQELDYFGKACAKKGQSPRERIIVVGKRHVDPDKRPSLLQGQEGFLFYTADPNDFESEHEFFRGEIQDRRYLDCLKKLSGHIWRAAERELNPRSARIAAQPVATPDVVPPTGRIMFVAKPANDMRTAYDRIVGELVGRGHKVVPDVQKDIPSASGAASYLDEALAAAEFSVHLLGNKVGPVPEDQAPITTLQLSRAAVRQGASPISRSATFRRLVWAPKMLDRDNATPERDPIAVLKKFGDQLPSDKVEGDHLSSFVDFLNGYIVDTTPHTENRPLNAAATIYFYHAIEDSDYVEGIAGDLEQRSVEALFPAFEGPPADLAAFHQKNLKRCDAVVLCWAEAPEVWVRTRSDELRDWHELGRSAKFAYRGLIAGPPPNGRKKFLAKRPPRNDIDFVLDLTETGRLSREAIDKLVSTVQQPPS